MNAIDPNYPASIDDHAWLKILAKYRTPHRGRSAFELAVTAIPFVVLWVLSWLSVHYEFWWGLALTAKPGQLPPLNRTVGYYVLDQPSTGGGIRPRPYTTSLSANNYTYGRISAGTLTIPHGIGFV